MSRIITLIVSGALLVGLFDAPRVSVRSYRPLTAGTQLSRIAVIGDSYTTGTDEGGLGSRGWTARAWQTLARQGVQIAADVQSEGGAGYGTKGNRGSIFQDLTARAVEPDDMLVVFFGSRNDQGVDPGALSTLAHDAFALARSTSPSAKLLVIGPPWPTAKPPGVVLRIRDIISAQAKAAGAVFVDPIAQGWFVGKTDLIGADGVHPNDAGHAYMAAKIAPLIVAQLPSAV